MASSRDRINAMDDFQVMRFFEHFGRELLGQIDAPLDQLLAGVPAALRKEAVFTHIEQLGEADAERAMPAADAVLFVRGTLLQLADDRQFAPLLDAILADYRDDAMVVDIILAVGFAASMVLLVATTGIEIRIGNVKIKKETASADMVRAILEPLSKVFGA
jgi:hypothetical protein